MLQKSKGKKEERKKRQKRRSFESKQKFVNKIKTPPI